MEPTVGYSSRAVEREVGGNSRYIREIHLAEGVRPYYSQAVSTPDLLRGLPNPLRYGVWEAVGLPTRHEVDVLHYPTDTGAAVKGKVPIVATIHGIASLHVPGIRPPFQERLWRARVQRTANVASIVITPSKSSARDLARAFDVQVERIRVIPHGVDGKFQPAEKSARVLLESGIELPESYLLYVGNTEPRKNLGNLIEAAELLYREFGVPLVIAGAPALDSRALSRQLAVAESVIAVGRVNDTELVQLYQQALLCCCPSEYEGFGLPVIEAMACGTPVVCSDKGSLQEIGEGAALFTAGLGVQAIFDAVGRLIKDPQARQELSQAGIQNSKRYSWSESRRAHAEAFRAACGAA